MHGKTSSAGKRHGEPLGDQNSRGVVRSREEEEEEDEPCVRLSADSAMLIKAESSAEASDNNKPVIRLEVTQKHIEVVREPKEPAVRLEQQGDLEQPYRSHEPGVEAIIDLSETAVISTEELWEQHQPKDVGTIPIGWIILLSLLIVSGLIWSLSQWKKGNDEIRQTQKKVEILQKNDEKEVMEATQLVNSIHAALIDYFKCTTIAELGSHVRHPERVVPLMQAHYKDQPVFIGTVSSINHLRPLNIDHRTRFWVAAVILSNGHKPLINLECTPSGAVLIDWESLVCYQSMNWTEYAQKRPAGTTMDFRVYGEPIDFNTHEFENGKDWLCIRLTAYDSMEFLFGYARIHSEEGVNLREMFKKNKLRKSTLTLRLTLPDGLQSPRGVLIDKILSPGWIYLDPPDSSLPPSSATPTDFEIEAMKDRH